MADISPKKHASIVTFHQHNPTSSRDIFKKIGVPQTSVSSTKLWGQSAKTEGEVWS